MLAHSYAEYDAEGPFGVVLDSNGRDPLLEGPKNSATKCGAVGGGDHTVAIPGS